MTESASQDCERSPFPLELNELVRQLRLRQQVCISYRNDGMVSVALNDKERDPLCQQAADEIERLQAAWDSAFNQAMKNGEALAAARSERAEPSMDNDSDWQDAHAASMALDEAIAARSKDGFRAALARLRKISSVPSAGVKPIGYAVRMADGPFVGIWQERATADHVCSKQPAAHGDYVLPVYALPSATAASIDEPVDERDWFTKLKKAQPATAERMFPMQDGPAIPWSLAEVIWQGYAALFGKGQKLERVGERGGFGWGEVAAFWSKPKAREAITAALAANRQPAEEK